MHWSASCHELFVLIGMQTTITLLIRTTIVVELGYKGVYRSENSQTQYLVIVQCMTMPNKKLGQNYSLYYMNGVFQRLTTPIKETANL